MISRFYLLGVNHRLVTFMFLVLVTTLTALGLPRLQVDTGLASLIPDDNPNKLVYQRVSHEFGSDNRTLVYVRDHALWTPRKLAQLEKLHDALARLGFVERVDDIFTLRTIRGVGDRIDSRPLLPEGTRDGATIERARKDALDNPLIVGNYVSRDGSAIALVLSVRESRDPNFDHRVNATLDRVIAPLRGSFDQIFQVGPSRINAELESSLFQDFRFLGPLSAGLLVLTVLVFFRSLFAAWVPLLTAGLSIVWTFGLMGYLGIPLNILSAMLPSLVVVIGSTEDIHMIAAYFQGVSHGGENTRDRATRHMVAQLGVPLFLTILTTALGFASNVFSDIDLIRDFAVASTFAILANGVITILFVPMILSVAGPRRTRIFDDHGRARGLTGLVVGVLGFGRRKLSGTILLVTALLCAFFLYEASKLYVTNDPMSYLRGNHSLIRQTHEVQRELAGTKVFFVTLESDQDKAFLDPKNLQKLVEIQKFMKKQGVFDRSISIADDLALVNREFHGGDPAFYKVPVKRDLVAQYLLFFNRRDIEGFISHDFRRANILVRHDVSDSRILNRNIRELRDVVTRVAGADMKGYVVGENLMVNAAAETLISAQARSLGILIVVIFLVMSVTFTSFKGGIVSVIPSVIPIILMFGVMGLLGIPLNPGTAMVAVIAIGIAIDGTIVLFSRYNELCRQSSDYDRAVHQTVSEEATPVLATSLSLAMGFGILLLSNFTIIAQFGALSAATMLFSIFTNLLITPIIMSRVRLVGLYEILAMSMQREVLERSALFQDMSNYQVRKAILISERQLFAPGELLMEQGAHGRSMYLVLSGEVEVVRRTNGEALRVAVRGAGHVFGEVGYIRETERTADVRALTPVEALRFDFERMKKDLRFFPRIVAKLNFNISRILGERLADVMDSLSGGTAGPAPADPAPPAPAAGAGSPPPDAPAGA